MNRIKRDFDIALFDRCALHHYRALCKNKIIIPKIEDIMKINTIMWRQELDLWCLPHERYGIYENNEAFREALENAEFDEYVREFTKHEVEQCMNEHGMTFADRQMSFYFDEVML